MYIKYIPILLLLFSLSIINIGCKTSNIAQCNSSAPEDNFYCYVPRIIPNSGVAMSWFPCSQNDKGAIHKSCKYYELDEECFIFVRAEYKDNIINPKYVEVTPLKLIDKNPEDVDITAGVNILEFKYPIEYFYVNKRDLLDKKNDSIYQGNKIRKKYLFKDAFLAYQNATLYDSAFDGSRSAEVRRYFTVDSVGKGCKRILGKSLCEQPEFAAARCNTIPCADFTLAKKFEPFNPKLFINKYTNHDPNVYPLLRSTDANDYILCKGDKNRFAYVNFTITKNIDHIHEVKFTRNNIETVISLDPENKDSLNKEYIRYCETNEITRSKRYVVKIPITAYRNNFLLYDKALERVVTSDLLYGSHSGYDNTRHMTLYALNSEGLNIITNEDNRIKSACRSNFSQTLYDAFSMDNKIDLIHPTPYSKINLGIYMSVDQKPIGRDTYFDTDGNLKIDAERYWRTLTRNGLVDSYPDSIHKNAIYSAMSATYNDMAENFQAKEYPIIFVANSVTLALVLDGVYIKMRRTPLKYTILKAPHDLLKGIPAEDGNKGVGGLSGMTGPHYSWEGFDRTYTSTISGVFKTLGPTTLSNGALTVNNCVAYTMIHEIGHLWASREIMLQDRRDISIPESNRHSYYCTGKNAKICIFRYDPTGGAREQYTIFNRVGPIWCEGHKQILLNVNKKQIVE